MSEYSRAPMFARIRTIGILCGALGASVLYSADFSHYRGLQFGMNVSDAAKAAGTATAEASSFTGGRH